MIEFPYDIDFLFDNSGLIMTVLFEHFYCKYFRSLNVDTSVNFCIGTVADQLFYFVTG